MDIKKPFCLYDLTDSRKHRLTQSPFPHQTQALSHLKKWLVDAPQSNAGGIVVLPTGGGKTFTAIRFLCSSVIGQRYKVLWLAHTHHLLEQAYFAFAKSVATISEPKSSLAVRLVSGTEGHDPVHRIKWNDDVIIATLQTTTLAFERGHPALMTFLKEAGDRLCVVFDEAHHAPAPSYRKLLNAMRAKHSEMILVGLTATPTNTNPRTAGWLTELFPQGIIHQSAGRDLIAARILARPNFEKIPTNFTPDFDEAECSKWVETYRDLPESIIEGLSKNKDRNALIADHYFHHRQRFGKTIIFAERWYQCEQIVSFLVRKGVRAGAVYSRSDGNESARTNENHLTLEKYKSGEIDVLLNVNMLIEGTDVPQTQTVFVTRQTTSVIRLTQMVGRALRGPAVGGTEEAYLVSFEDNWKQKINWADFDQLSILPPEDLEKIPGKTLPVQMISIDLVRRLADQMDSGVNVASMEFVKLLPIGWYSAEFETLLDRSDDVEIVRSLVMVFEGQHDGYEKFLDHLETVDRESLKSERASLSGAEPMITDMIGQFFPVSFDEMSRVVVKDLFHLARHVAQKDGDRPRFFPFEERSNHDLDAVAQRHILKDVGPRQVHQNLVTEFGREDRFWKNLYPRFELFITQYDACLRRILIDQEPPLPPPPPPPDELSPEVKKAVKKRDGWRCLCCGEARTRRLQIDHIIPRYYGGTHEMENLQTLCQQCNGEKGITSTNFRLQRDEKRVDAPSQLPSLYYPELGMEGDSELWGICLRRMINFFYNAAAVQEVRIGAKGRGYHEWIIPLHEGNRPDWIRPHLPAVLDHIRSTRSRGGLPGPEGIRVVGSDGPEAACFAAIGENEQIADFPGLPNGTLCRVAIDDSVPEGIFLRGQLKFGHRSPFGSFSEAYRALAGRQRNDWRGWEFRLPNTAEWMRGDELRQTLNSTEVESD